MSPWHWGADGNGSLNSVLGGHHRNRVTQEDAGGEDGWPGKTQSSDTIQLSMQKLHSVTHTETPTVLKPRFLFLMLKLKKKKNLV